MEKLKTGIFDNPKLCQLIRDPVFENSTEQSKTGNMEGFCSCHEELYWQQEDQKLQGTCHQYAECFQKPWM